MVKNIFFAVAAVVSTVAFGGPFDDVAWMMRPNDFNGNGLIDQGEVVNRVKGGDSASVTPSATHGTIPYGYDFNRKIEDLEVNTAFVKGKTLSAIYLSDATMDKEGVTWYYCGNMDATAAIKPCMGTSAGGATVYIRAKCKDVARNTSWILCTSGSIGFNGSKVRFYGDASSNFISPDLPVSANEWVDLCFTFSGNNIHVVMMRETQGDKVYTYDYAAAKNYTPTSSSKYYIGQEGNTTAESSTAPGNSKRYTGWIQQLALWKRPLSDGEILEVFKIDSADIHEAGVANASNAEFGGATTTFALEDEWANIPASISAGDVWTVKATLTAEEAAKGHNLVFSSASGSGTLSAQIGAGAASTADVAPDQSAKLFLPATDLVAGENTITLTCTAGSDIALDKLELVEGAKTTRYVYDQGGTVDISNLNITVNEGEAVEFYVSPTTTARFYSNVTIAGAGKVIKTGGGTLYFRTGKLGFTGGLDVEEGSVQTVFSQGASGFGDGSVRVFAENDACIYIQCAKFSSPIEVVGTSPSGKPAIRLGMGSYNTSTTMEVSSTITGTGDICISDTWGSTDYWSYGYNQERIVLTGPISAPNGTISWAPNTIVRFKGKITALTLEGCFADCSKFVTADVCPSRGNLGAFVLAATNDIATLSIDQTRVICDCDYCFGNTGKAAATALLFTGEHLNDDWGYLDLNGHNQRLRAITAPTTLTRESEGARIWNSSDTLATLYPGNESVKIGYTTYAKYDGNMAIGAVSGMSTVTYGPRRNLMTGNLFFSSAVSMMAGCSFENVKSLGSNSAANVDIKSLGEGAFASLTTLGDNGSGTYYVNPVSFTPGQVTLYFAGMNSSTYKSSSVLVVTGNVDFVVRKFRYYNWVDWQATDDFKGNKRNNSAYQVYAPVGRYAKGDPTGSGVFYNDYGSGVKIVVTDGPSPQTPLVWTGADGESQTISTANNWKDAGGTPLVEPPDTELPIYWPTFAAGGTVAQVLGMARFYGMIFNLAENTEKTFTIAAGDDAAKLVLSEGVLTCTDAIDAGTDYTVDVPIDIGPNAISLTIPSNGTFRLTGGITGTGNVTLNGSAKAGCTHGGSPHATTDGGVFYLGGTNDFAGDLKANAAVLHLSGVLGVENDTKKFTFGASTGTASPTGVVHGNLILDGVECRKEVSVSSLGQSTGVSNVQSAVVFTENTTNVFKKLFTFGASNYITLREGSRVVFDGGYKCTASQDMNTRGATIDFNGPITVTDTAKGRFGLASVGYGSTFNFNATGSVIGMYVNIGPNSANVNVDDPFTSIGSYTQVGYGDTKTYGLSFFTLNDGHRYTTPGFRGLVSSVICGTGTLKVTGGAASESDNLGAYSKGRFTESVNVELALVEDGIFTFYANFANTSTGLLTVSSGTAKFNAGANWAGDIRVNGGALNLLGNVKLADGRNLYIGDLVEPAEEGTYGAIGSGAKHEVSWITGAGKLRIGNAGMLFIVK